mmetsp:Transcript_66890/g.59993  ORF Transcript_66890/g.59993 Transcript_66890/m.59993 type:complete len:374 (-) Transcript_66890:187-1308(-)
MAFGMRVPRNPRRAPVKTVSSWQDELRKECYWGNELSFHNLKSQSLIQNYNEWRSIYNAFRYKHISSSSHIIKFLRNQKHHFRKSYLHYLLITGYSRTSNVSLFNVDIVPNEIQDIILFYANLIFIKLYESKSDDYRPIIHAFDCNFSVNNLRLILKKGESKQTDSDLRLWTHFVNIKSIYSVQKNGQQICTYHDDEEEEDNNRWVQIPTDHSKGLTLKEMDNKLKYHQVLEFGVDKFDESRQKWQFKKDKNEDEDKKENDNHFEWIQSLKVGDNIDVSVNYRWMKGFIFGRDYDTFYIHIENANTFRVYQDIEINSIGIENLQRLQGSDTHCKRTKLSSNQFDVNDENLVYCGWMTAFNTKSHSAQISIIFE